MTRDESESRNRDLRRLDAALAEWVAACLLNMACDVACCGVAPELAEGRIATARLAFGPAWRRETMAAIFDCAGFDELPIPDAPTADAVAPRREIVRHIE